MSDKQMTTQHIDYMMRTLHRATPEYAARVVRGSLVDAILHEELYDPEYAAVLAFGEGCKIRVHRRYFS